MGSGGDRMATAYDTDRHRNAANFQPLTPSPFLAPPRRHAPIRGFTLNHAETKVLIGDREFSKVMKEALGTAKVKPLIISYGDPEFTGAGERLGDLEYEDLLREGD